MSWIALKQKKEQRAAKLADARKLTVKAETEKRDLSAEELKQVDTMIGEAEALAPQIATLERLMALDGETRSATLGVPDSDLRRYSLLRAIQRRAANQALDGIEAEMDQEIARRTGKSAQGFFVPWNALEQRTDPVLNTGTNVGAGLVGTQVVPANFIELLRAKTLLNTLGARLLSGLSGKLAIPAQTGGATAYWVSEGGTVTASAQGTAQVPLTPKTVGCLTDLTRQMVHQSSIDAENFVRDDLIATLAIALDTAAFAGTGTDNQPKGLLNNADVPTHELGATGAALTWADVVALESLVATANADLGKLAYVTNPKVRGKLKTTLQNATAGAAYIWANDNTVNGYAAHASTIIPANLTKSTGTNLSALLFGNFDDLVVGIWGGGIDLLVDPYTLSSSGGIRLVALQDCDIAVRHAASFAKTVDVSTAA